MPSIKPESRIYYPHEEAIKLLPPITQKDDIMPLYYNQDISGNRDGTPYHIKAYEDFNTREHRITFRKIIDSDIRELIVSQGAPIVLMKIGIPAFSTTINSTHMLFIDIDFFTFILENHGLEEARYSLGEVLAHEYIHVRQLRTGRLVIDNVRGTLSWEGTERKLPCITTEREEYFNTPWEQEAYRANMEYAVAKGRAKTLEEAEQNLLECIFA